MRRSLTAPHWNPDSTGLGRRSSRNTVPQLWSGRATVLRSARCTKFGFNVPGVEMRGEKEITPQHYLLPQRGRRSSKKKLRRSGTNQLKTLRCLFLRNASGPWIELEPTEAILSYRHIRAGIKEIDKHKLFRMASEIIGIGIHEPFLAAKVRAEECFTDV